MRPLLKTVAGIALASLTLVILAPNDAGACSQCRRQVRNTCVHSDDGICSSCNPFRSDYRGYDAPPRSRNFYRYGWTLPGYRFVDPYGGLY